MSVSRSFPWSLELQDIRVFYPRSQDKGFFGDQDFILDDDSVRRNSIFFEDTALSQEVGPPLSILTESLMNMAYTLQRKISLSPNVISASDLFHILFLLG